MDQLRPSNTTYGMHKQWMALLVDIVQKQIDNHPKAKPTFGVPYHTASARDRILTDLRQKVTGKFIYKDQHKVLIFEAKVK